MINLHLPVTIIWWPLTVGNERFAGGRQSLRRPLNCERRVIKVLDFRAEILLRFF